MLAIRDLTAFVDIYDWRVAEDRISDYRMIG